MYIHILGPGVAQWLRNCATSRAVPGSKKKIPVASVTGIFFVDTDRTMCPGVNSASKKWVPGIPLGVKAAGAWGWRSTSLVVPNVKKSGALTYPDHLGPSRRPVVGETFTYIHTHIYRFYLFTFLYFEPDESKTLSPILFEHTFNIILLSTPCSSKYFLSFRLPHQNLHSFPSTHALCTSNFIFLI